jgi:uncharacterized membrane protein
MAPNPRSTAKIAGHPIHPMLVPFPIAFLVAVLVCDLAFWRSANSFWAIAAMWALGAALVLAAAAALAGLTDFIGDSRVRSLPAARFHLVGNVIAVVLALINFIIRWMNGAAAGVFPWGIWLSVIVVLMLLVTGWLGGELVFRHRVGVSDRAEP